MHVFVWGSILVWFVAIPSTSSQTFYSSFFRYGGVAFEVLGTATFWFYLPLATIIALAPTILFRLVNLYRSPTYVDFVRLKEKKDGKKIFKRRKLKRKGHSTHSMKRTGYAFAHQEGYGALITTGHIFGMDEENVRAEHLRRQSTFLSRSPSRAATEPPVLGTDDNDGGLPTKVSMSAITVLHNVSVEVVEIEIDPATPDTQSSERNLVEEPDIPAAKEDLVVTVDATAATGLNSEKEEELPISLEKIELDSCPSVKAAEGEAVEVEQTDSVLIPMVRIPGLVDSPESPGTEENVESEKEVNKGDDKAVEKEVDPNVVPT